MAKAAKKKSKKAANDALLSIEQGGDAPGKRRKLDRVFYEEELNRLQIELVKLQEWVKTHGLRVAVLFEGRDAAGKGSTIKRIADCLNPRVCRIVALGTPSDREETQWYFQRYVAELPAAGEICLFDRSWYNRAGVEHVMGFCSEEQHRDFLRDCPIFEKLLIDSGLILIKYWFSVSDAEQERRFRRRLKTPTKRWKLSAMDLEARARWADYSRAKDIMFEHTDSEECPWNVVDSEVKKRAHLNCIRHFLDQIPYEDLTPPPMVLPARPEADRSYVRPPRDSQHWIPDRYD